MCIDLDNGSSQRVPYQDVRARYVNRAQKRVEFQSELPCIPGSSGGRWLGSPQTSPVVSQSTRELGNSWLDTLPDAQVFTHSILKNHYRVAGAQFQHVEAVAADANLSILDDLSP